jgi:transposase
MESDIVDECFKLGLKYKDIVRVLGEHSGTTISERHLKRLLKRRGLHRRGNDVIEGY